MLNIRFRERTNSWPGFVDLFSNLVIILIFLLIVFVFLWTTTSVFNKESGVKVVSELKQTNAEYAEKIQQMTADEQEAKRLLILARAELENLESNNAELTNELTEIDLSIDDLINAYEDKVRQLQESSVDMQSQVAALTTQLAQANLDKQQLAALEQQRRELQTQMDAQRAALSEQLAAGDAERATLSEQLVAVQTQLAQLQTALDAAEAKSAEQEIQYVEMSSRLNRALADKVAELNNVAQYQSAFYRAVKDALDGRTTVQPDGDRFIVSSDILFPSGTYTLSAEGKNQLRLLANVIKSFEETIPSDVDWIIRVDGHTDKKQVVPGTRGYTNNMQLSLRRATAVVDELAKNGVSRRRLVPSGFGDMHPIALGSEPADLQQNRRIELQITNR